MQKFVCFLINKKLVGLLIVQALFNFLNRAQNNSASRLNAKRMQTEKAQNVICNEVDIICVMLFIFIEE